MPDHGVPNWTEIRQIAADHNISLREAKRVSDALREMERRKSARAGAGQTGETQGKAAWERANGTNGPFGWVDLAEDEKAAWRNAGQTEVRDA